MRFYLPTCVFAGSRCVRDNAQALRPLGRHALLVTGRGSASRSGALSDMEQGLASQGISFDVFEGADNNPDYACCMLAAEAARDTRADFIVGIGGGSPLDTAKTAALLARNELSEPDLYAGSFRDGALPIVAVPTTAGTGSEATPYAVLTNHAIESKSTIATDALYPRVAFLDPAYTASLPRRVAVSTALDAMSHAIEGSLALRASAWSSAIAREALAIIGRSLPALARGDNGEGLRTDMLLAANMAGVVIAQTATTIVHAMGYPLSHFKGVEHGRANGMLLAAYLEMAAEHRPDDVREVLRALGCQDVAAFRLLIDPLVGPKETMSAHEATRFTAMALGTKHLANTPGSLGKDGIRNLYARSLTVR